MSKHIVVDYFEKLGYEAVHYNIKLVDKFIVGVGVVNVVFFLKSDNSIVLNLPLHLIETNKERQIIADIKNAKAFLIENIRGKKEMLNISEIFSALCNLYDNYM